MVIVQRGGHKGVGSPPSGGSQGGREPPLSGGFEWHRYPPSTGFKDMPWEKIFGPYIRLVEPTYGFVHDFRTWFLDVMVFDPWFWMRWFSGYGIVCFNMYKYVL